VPSAYSELLTSSISMIMQELCNGHGHLADKLAGNLARFSCFVPDSCSWESSLEVGDVTSEEIKQHSTPKGESQYNRDDWYWLKEIAYQLAVMNERNADDKKGLNVILCASNDSIPVTIA
jgi:hypothetical protein